MKFIVSPNDGSDPIVCTTLVQLSKQTGVSPSYLRQISKGHRKGNRKKFKINRINVTIVE